MALPDAKVSTAAQKPAVKVTAREIDLPKGGGTLRGMGDSFTSDSFTGTGKYAVNFPVTTARGFEPTVRLNYDSGTGNGPFGLGFDIGIARITLRTDKGIPRYDGTDLYMLADGTEIVQTAGTTSAPNPRQQGDATVTSFVPRVQQRYDSIELWKVRSGTYWKIRTRDNIVHVFGNSDGSRLVDPMAPTHVFGWLLVSSADPRGNKISYDYKAEDNPAPASRYIRSIQYGNYFEDSTEKFAFEVIFDYGEYDISHWQSSYNPVGPWSPRPDPFSSFKSGFEMRCCRLCKNILLFHHFDKELGGPCLVRSLALRYGQPSRYGNTDINGISMLTALTLTGYRANGIGSADTAPVPTVMLGFSGFEPPASPGFGTLALSNGDPAAPGYLDGMAWQPVDIYGDGLPGFLFGGQMSSLYLEPLGKGHYLPAVTLQGFPVEKDLQHGQGSFEDIDGNGALELVIRRPGLAGFYPNRENGAWDSFSAFTDWPVDGLNPRTEQAGLSSNGKTDLLLAFSEKLYIYASEGAAGYAPASIVDPQPDFPLVKEGYAGEIVCFADIFGDGLPHRVRIRSGSVECWPCLGYGRFGPKRILANPPVFDGVFDAGRLLLADFDGAGPQGIAYIYPDRVDIFLNESGNSFSGAIAISLPEPYNTLDRLSFSDLLGTGSPCLNFTKITPSPRHYFYNLTGSKGSGEPAIKPYLLTVIDNGMGGLTEIGYASSTKFALRDKQAGKPWITKLRFPVQVVEKITVTEKLTGALYTKKFCYHNGRYDHTERAFCGFGLVETWDSESFAEFQQETAAHGLPPSKLNEELYVPPCYTRTWHHTGAPDPDGRIAKLYKAGYFQGDPKALDFPKSSINITGTDPETLRQAFFALKGQVLRLESYGQDGTALEANPYTVGECCVTVALLQAKGPEGYAVFTVNPAQKINYQYERQPTDPRVIQEFTLAVDQDSGETTKACRIFLPRREDTVTPPLATAFCHDFIGTAEGSACRYRGLPWQQQEMELLGLVLPSAGYFAASDVAPVITALDIPLLYDEPPAAGQLQARQRTWTRQIFWDDTQDAAAPMGTTGSRALLHHTEDAKFTLGFVNDVFDNRLNNKFIRNQGGYDLDSDSKYYWDKGLTAYYFDSTQPDHFYQLKSVVNSLADPSTPLAIRTDFDYDNPYIFSETCVTRYIDETTRNVNTVRAAIDYITLLPWQMTDINGNTAQVLFDPLGRVVVTSLFGTENGQLAGGMSLYDQGTKKKEYQLPADASFDTVSRNPGGYVSGACSYYFYDLFAWQAGKKPVSSIAVTRTSYYHQGANTTPAECRVMIGFSDGLGNPLETKILTSPDAGERWIVSGRKVYDNKGNPCQQYLPYFSSQPYYENQQEIIDKHLVPPPTVFHYDPLCRLIRTDTPKGFFSKVEFSAWEIWHYDQDDTVLDSWYYQHFPADGPPDEKAALAEAAGFYNTPSKAAFNSMGQICRVTQDNLGNVTPAMFAKIVRNSAVTAQQLFDQLLAKGYLVASQAPPVGTWLSASFQPYTPGFQLHLDPTYQTFAAPLIQLLKQGCLATVQDPDIDGRTLQSVDPRLYYMNCADGKDYFSFRYRYAMGEAYPLLTETDWSDTGQRHTEKHLNNIFGNQAVNISARDYCQVCGYDHLQRRVSLLVKKLETGEVVNPANWFALAEMFRYGDDPKAPPAANLRGQLWQINDLSGTITNTGYSMQGAILQSTRVMIADPATAVDWNNPPLLEPASEAYAQSFTYNALNQMLTETSPDGSVTANTFNNAGQLQAVALTCADGTAIPILTDVDYEAWGKRRRMRYGNGVTSFFSYQDTTLRLSSIETIRPGQGLFQRIQGLSYSFDPVGNLLRVQDDCLDTVFNKNQKVDPVMNYCYDALYRLSQATGRQHESITQNTCKNNQADGSFKQSVFSPLPGISDSSKLINYKEYYQYDDSGNLTCKKHQVVNGSPAASWNRPTPVIDNANRLVGISYDAAGNQLSLDLNTPVRLYYNCCENLVRTGTISRPRQDDDADYYLYDAGGRRTRKVTEQSAHGGTLLQRVQKTYIGNYEEKKIMTVSSGQTTLTLQRQSLRVMDGDNCLAIVHYWVKDDGQRECDKPGTRETRFQLGNYQGSVSLELDGSAKCLSYEEYFPYGGTAIIAGPSKLEVSLKEYRYSAKERDDSTGLYYYGTRYYAPWLGRWLRTDPGGTVDGLNLYAFSGGNPITYTDPDGQMKRSRDEMERKPDPAPRVTRGGRPQRPTRTTVRAATRGYRQKANEEFGEQLEPQRVVHGTQILQGKEEEIVHPAPMSEERLIVRHLSTYLLAMNPGMVEVQAAISHGDEAHPGTIYVASNTKERSLKAALSGVTTLEDFQPEESEEFTERQNRHIRQLAQEVNDRYKDYEIVHVRGLASQHAETKILQHIRDFDYIGGTRRPCFLCTLTFHMLEIPADRFNPHPGAFWDSINAAMGPAAFGLDPQLMESYAFKGKYYITFSTTQHGAEHGANDIDSDSGGDDDD